MICIDQACRPLRINISIAPSQYRVDRFGRITLAMRMRSQHIAKLGHAVRWIQITLVRGETDFADELSLPVFDRPAAETEQLPMSTALQEFRPAFLLRKRHAADMAHD